MTSIAEKINTNNVQIKKYRLSQTQISTSFIIAGLLLGALVISMNSTKTPIPAVDTSISYSLQEYKEMLAYTEGSERNCATYQ